MSEETTAVSGTGRTDAADTVSDPEVPDPSAQGAADREHLARAQRLHQGEPFAGVARLASIVAAAQGSRG